jgi:hypothetical protein
MLFSELQAAINLVQALGAGAESIHRGGGDGNGDGARRGPPGPRGRGIGSPEDAARRVPQLGAGGPEASAQAGAEAEALREYARRVDMASGDSSEL